MQGRDKIRGKWKDQGKYSCKRENPDNKSLLGMNIFMALDRGLSLYFERGRWAGGKYDLRTKIIYLTNLKNGFVGRTGLPCDCDYHSEDNQVGGSQNF
jgi:hypothetical protein